MISPEDLEAIRKRAEAAEAGPWAVDEITGEDIEDCGDADRVISRGIDGPGEVGLNTGVEYQMYSVADAQFIAHARTDVPLLVDEVERLQGLLKEWSDAYTEMGRVVQVAGGAEWANPVFVAWLNEMDRLSKLAPGEAACHGT